MKQKPEKKKKEQGAETVEDVEMMEVQPALTDGRPEEHR